MLRRRSVNIIIMVSLIFKIYALRIVFFLKWGKNTFATKIQKITEEIQGTMCFKTVAYKFLSF